MLNTVNTRTTVILRLNDIERYREKDDQKREFYVEYITVSVSSDHRLYGAFATLKGRLIKTDGNQGYNNRTRTILWRELEPKHREEIRKLVNKGRENHSVKEPK